MGREAWRIKEQARIDEQRARNAATIEWLGKGTAKKRFADSPVALVGLGSACEYHAVSPSVVEKNIDETKAFIDLSAELGGSGVKVRPNGLPSEVPVEKTL